MAYGVLVTNGPSDCAAASASSSSLAGGQSTYSSVPITRSLARTTRPTGRCALRYSCCFPSRRCQSRSLQDVPRKRMPGVEGFALPMGKCRKPTPRRCLAIWVQVPCGPVGALPSWSPLSGAHRRSARQAGRLGDRRHFGSVLAAAVPDPLPERTLSGGRYQILPIAWDGHRQTESGQRWFHLYPKRRVGHRDPLLWTGRYQNGALQCAECQSTQLRKGYGAAPQTQQTTFTEIDVACESCHGPASVHVDGARSARLPDAVSDGQASPAIRTSVKSEDPAPRSRAVTTWQCSRPRTSRQTVGTGTRSMAGL